MSNYESAIGILSKLTSETAYQMVFEIAKTKPSAVVQAFQKMNPSDVDNEILAYAADRSKIDTIKFTRALTGEGLREAKEHVERLCSFGA